MKRRNGSGAPSATVLVLTATLDPAGTPLVLRSDPRKRLDDYRRALAKWIQIRNSFTQIVMIENSSHEYVKELAAEFGDVEIISYKESDTTKHRGKGYGEALMLERLAQQSFPGATYLLKCSGRLYCRNIVRLLRTLNSQPDIVVRLSVDLKYADSRLFAVRCDLLADLIRDLKEDVDDPAGVYIEHALARATLRMASEGYRVTTWPWPPFYVGRSASIDNRYDSLVKYAVWPMQALIQRVSRLNRYR